MSRKAKRASNPLSRTSLLVILGIAMVAVIILFILLSLPQEDAPAPYIPPTATAVDPAACDSLPPVRIAVGDTVRYETSFSTLESTLQIMSAPFESGAGLPPLREDQTALVLEGFECHIGRRTGQPYRFWKIRTDEGVEGWVDDYSTYEQASFWLERVE